ncbi:MAG: acetylglutamate kinase [Candidatus Omnitrophota bacterium]
MEEAIKKADVLIEALSYLQKFHKKVIVVKYGGSGVEDEQIRSRVLEDIVFLHTAGTLPVLVHGGGPSITKRMQQRGMKISFVEGLRATDLKTVKIVDEVLSELNAKIVREIQSLGAKAQGVLSRKSKVILAIKKKIGKKSLGYTGDVKSVNVAPIKKVFKIGAIPVVSPVAIGKDKKLYNINADEVAAALACALGAEKLILLTNVRGIMTDRHNDENSILSTLDTAGARHLVKRNVIDSGMIPKVNAAISALTHGVKKVHIIDWRVPHSILLEIFTQKGVGTEIVK